MYTFKVFKVFDFRVTREGLNLRISTNLSACTRVVLNSTARENAITRALLPLALDGKLKEVAEYPF